jgi:hypothetical protein
MQHKRSEAARDHPLGRRQARRLDGLIRHNIPLADDLYDEHLRNLDGDD